MIETSRRSVTPPVSRMIACPRPIGRPSWTSLPSVQVPHQPVLGNRLRALITKSMAYGMITMIPAISNRPTTTAAARTAPIESVAVSPGNTFAGNQLNRSRTSSAPEHREQQDRRLGVPVAQGDQAQRQAGDGAHPRLHAVEARRACW